MLTELLKALLGRERDVEPDFARALRCYVAADHAAAALLCERRLARAQPGDTDAWCLLALCREAAGERASAQEAWHRVLSVEPTHAEALCAVGEPGRATGLARAPEESRESFERRLRYARAMVLYWAQQDRLWRHGVVRDPRIALPVWDGGQLAGRRVLVHAMGGFGDTVNFGRFAADLAERGAIVRLECGRPLHRLLGRCPGVGELVEAGAQDAARGCDLQAPLVVLLKHFFFAELQRARGAYLNAAEQEAASWAARLEARRGYRVGLCWAGNPANKNDARRSLSLAQLEPVLRVPGVHWVSLQKGPAAAQLARIPGLGIDDWVHELGDFAATAALIANLDAVISVDTAVAHVAGALGTPVWLLYAHDVDRRWEVVDDPQRWYPHARLFRQARPGDWRAPANAAAAALEAAVAKRVPAYR